MKNIIEKVEELENFPFKNFSEFKESINKKESDFFVGYPSAFQWIQTDKHVPGNVKTQTRIYAMVPYIIMVLILIYSIVSKHFSVLLTLPFAIIGFYLLSPSSPPRKLIVNASIMGVILSLIFSKEWTMILSTTLIAFYYSYEFLYGTAVKEAFKAIEKHEDLLCIFWQTRGLSIVFSNGDEYTSFYKKIDGKNQYY